MYIFILKLFILLLVCAFLQHAITITNKSFFHQTNFYKNKDEFPKVYI